MSALWRIADKALNFNVWMLKSRFSSCCVIPERGPDVFKFVWMIGIALPSLKYYPAAWNILQLEQLLDGSKFGYGFIRWRVGDYD